MYVPGQGEGGGGGSRKEAKQSPGECLTGGCMYIHTYIQIIIDIMYALC